VLLLARPEIDGRWESHPAHFWLVLFAALVNVGLGWTVTETGRRRRDARLLLIGLAFVASAGFLGLHALATPGVLVESNAGFELATPVGLLVAGGLAALSSLELAPARSAALVGASRPLFAAMLALFAVWAVFALAQLPPLDEPVAGESLDGWQTALAATGVVLYAAAAFGYARLYRRRRAAVVFAVTFAFVLLAEAMIVIAWARNWQLSWWEWHVLMLLAFAVIAVSARREWHEERWAAFYLDDTLAGARDVSILFADLAGYTAYSERCEPAEVQQMLNTYWERLVPLLQAHGAIVPQFVGDQVFAHWNTRDDQPDHPRLAAAAALAFQRAAGEVARDDWPRFRAGVNSGEVVAGVTGARGHREHGVVGDTVNLAARLEGAAPVGGVVIGEETFRRLGSAEVEPLPELQVKGKREPVRAYVLRRLGEEER
jgi:class 3 adenylate cyclase